MILESSTFKAVLYDNHEVGKGTGGTVLHHISIVLIGLGES